MDWAGKQHPVETLAEWCAPALFAGAVGWSASTIGLALPAIAAGTLAGFVAAIIVIRTLGRSGGGALPAFSPAPFDADNVEPDELLLDDPLIEIADGGELLLDDPLVAIADDARVVRLFAKQEPTPGELVLRIEDFLGEGRRPAPRYAADMPASAAPDAGAALQTALANIRASLR